MHRKLMLLFAALLMTIGLVACNGGEATPAPTTAPAPTQTPKTTKVTPEPGGKGIMGASASFPAMTLDELITHSDAIIIGKVADILPARKGKDPRGMIPEIIYQDVIVQTERYLYGEPESEFIAIRVLGGKIGDTYFISDADPEFTVGEEALLFLYIPPKEFIQNVPEGIDSRSIYKVTASIPGKHEFKDGILTDYRGQTTNISTVEEKIAAASQNQ